MHRGRDDQPDGRGYEDLCAGWSASAIVIIWREKHVDERCKKTVVIKNLYYGEIESEDLPFCMSWFCQEWEDRIPFLIIWTEICMQ